MALPPPVRYWLIRFQRFNRPWIWSGMVLLILGGVVGRQYYLHPEWYGRFNVPEDSPTEASLADTSLTPEEQAQIADIDNLNTLMQEIGLAPITPDGTETPLTPEAGDDTLLSLLQRTDASGLSQATPGATNESPFADYLDQYKFAGGSSPSQDAQRSQLPTSSSLSQAGLRSDPNYSADGTATPSLLQQALLNLPPENSSPDSPSQADESSEPTPTDPSTEGTFSGLQPPPWLVQGSLPGSNQPFIRTTPEMSPPPGTTGYTMPMGASPLPTVGSTNSYPALGAVTPSTAVPNLSPGSLRGSTSGSLGAISGSSSTLPPASGTTYNAPNTAVPEPAPFTVPRPPGSYTGGGYINTFSDPGGYSY